MNEVLKATIDVLAQHDIKPTVKHGGKHLHVEFEMNGQSRTIVVSATPSDRRAALGARTVARRVYLRAPADLEPVALVPADPEMVEAPRRTRKDYVRATMIEPATPINHVHNLRKSYNLQCPQRPFRESVNASSGLTPKVRRRKKIGRRSEYRGRPVG
jgi:hypothetical protein